MQADLQTQGLNLVRQLSHSRDKHTEPRRLLPKKVMYAVYDNFYEISVVLDFVEKMSFKWLLKILYFFKTVNFNNF